MPTEASATEPRFTAVLIEDDQRLCELTARYLRAHGSNVHTAHDGAAGLELVRAVQPEVVVLDVMLPRMDGLAVCKSLRQFSDVPVVMLTARDTEHDRVLGLELGADDYVVKPFSSPELLARLRAQVRRRRGFSAAPTTTLRVGPVNLDRATRAVTVNDQELVLTTLEFELLAALLEQAGSVLSREQLIERLHRSPDEVFDRSIDVHVSRLRQKLGDDSRAPRWIKTVRGMGYLFAREAP